MSIDEVFAVYFWRLGCSWLVRAFCHHETADLGLLIVLNQVDKKETLLPTIIIHGSALHKHNQGCIPSIVQLLPQGQLSNTNTTSGSVGSVGWFLILTIVDELLDLAPGRKNGTTRHHIPLAELEPTAP